MRKIFTFLSALSLTFCFDCMAQTSDGRNSSLDSKTSATHSRELVKGELLVKFKAGVKPTLEPNGLKSCSNPTLQKALQGIGCSNLKSLSPQPVRNGLKSASIVPQVYKISFDTTVSVEAAQKALEQLDCVEIVEPNYKMHCYEGVGSTSANQLIDQQWNIMATNIEALWQVPVTNTKRPVITILDSGVDINHPDLKDNIWTNEAEANGLPGVDDDGNGYIDDIHGYDIRTSSSRIVDENGHGTHCAGIAAAKNNNLGIVGMNPDALIMPVRIGDAYGNITNADFIEGVNYAVAAGTDIISMSLSLSKTQLMEDCLKNAYKSCFLVAAAGNDGSYVMDYPSFPGSVDYVLGVEATQKAGGLTSFSNYDADGPYCYNGGNYEVRAPGDSIISTVPDGYAFMKGTSMACPCVAGIVSRLMMCKDYPDWKTLKNDLIYATSDNLDAYKAYLGMDKDQTIFELTQTNEKVELVDSTYWFDFQPVFTNFGSPVGDFTYSVSVVSQASPTFKVISGDQLTCKAMASGEEQMVSEPFRLRLDSIMPIFENGTLFSNKLLILKVNADFGDHTYSKTVNLPLASLFDDLWESITYGSSSVDTTKSTTPIDSTFLPINHKITLSETVSFTKNVTIGQADTLVVMPGTELYFDNTYGPSGLNCLGTFICKGTKEHPIQFHEMYVPDASEPEFSVTLAQPSDIEYADFSICNMSAWNNVHFKNCTFGSASCYQLVNLFAQNCVFDYCHVSEVYARHFVDNCQFNNCNIVGVEQTLDAEEDVRYFIQPNSIHYCNVYGNTLGSLNHLSIAYYSAARGNVVMEDPNFLGYDDYLPIARRVFDVNNPVNHKGTGVINYETNRSKDLIASTPVLASVVLNGQETRDADKIYLPLFGSAEVSFNKSMDTVAPLKNRASSWLTLRNMKWKNDKNLSFDFELNTIFYLEIDTLRDLVNQEIPYLYPSNAICLKSGHLMFGFRGRYDSTGVKFDWVKTTDPDAVGYQIFFSQDKDFSISVRQINVGILPVDSTSFKVLFDPEQYNDFWNYNGYYKLMKIDAAGNKTQLYETIKIAITNPTWTDSNRRYDTYNDETNGCEPVTYDLPTILELYQVLVENGLNYTTCLDVNDDGNVNIADVVNIQKEYEIEPYMSSATDAASFSVENDTLFVTSTVDLAGIEIYFNKAKGCGVEILEGLSEMERFFRENPVDSCTGNVLFAYSLNKGKIPAGKQPLLKFNCSNFDITSVVMSDEGGHTLSGVDLVFNDSDDQETEQNYDVHYYTILGTEVDAEVAKKRPGFYIKSLFSNGRCHKSYKVRVTDFK